MEEPRAAARRIPNGGGRRGYDDVFGGPPRYAPPLDYAEIFGGLAAACSIPFLDLPPPLLHADDPAPAPAAGFDYDDIFGGFAAAHEPELLAEPVDGRTLGETDFGHNVEEVAKFPPDEPSGENAACLESLDKDQVLSNSDHSNDGSERFDTSLHKPSQGSIGDAVNGTTYFNQLHTSPGITVFVDSSSPLDNKRSDNTPSLLTINLGLKADSNDAMSESNQEFSPPTSSGGSVRSSVMGQKDQQPFTTTKDLPAEDAYVNVKQHSRSSSYHSTSSGDIYYTDATYVTLSDITLRTQSLQVPPPSRPPPNLVNKQGIPVTKKHAVSKADLDDIGLYRHVMDYRTQCSDGVSRKHSLQDHAKDRPGFYDVEVDVTSAAAASAAAMKEAMEQAQARINTAKELMERKRENIQNRKKLGHPDGIKYREKCEDKVSQEVKVLTEERFQKTLVNEDEKVHFAVDNCQEAKAIVAADHDEKETHATDEAQQKIREKESKSSNVLYNLGEEIGEWKKDEQFYELINNEKKSKTVKDVHEQEDLEEQQKATKKSKAVKDAHEQEDIEKQQKSTANSNGDRENATKVTKKNRKLWEINDSRECEVKHKILRAGNMDSSGKEIKKIASSIPIVHLQKENINKLDITHDLLKQEENKKKLKLAQENDIGKEEAKTIVYEEDSSLGISEKKLEPSNDGGKHEKNHEGGDEGRALETAVFHGCVVCEKKLNQTCGNSEPHESEVKLNQAHKSCIQDVDKKEVRVPNGSCVLEAAEKIKVVLVASQGEVVKETKGAADCESWTDENLSNPKSIAARLDQEVSKIMNGIPEACQWGGNENQLGVKFAESAEKLGGLEEVLEQTENEVRMKTVKEPCEQDHNDRKTKETLVKAEHKEKKQDAVQLSDLEGSEKKLTMAEGHLEHEVLEKDNDIQSANKLDKKCNGLNEFEGVCWNIAEDNLEVFEQVCVLRKKGDIRISPEDDIETHGTISTEKNIPDAREVKEKEREIEHEKEQARRLEEKEREREREKDSLAVEKATHDAHERSLAEARERAERIAVERVTAEARQRALADAREKAEKASAEALEKTIAEKASREARLKAERAAVERATTEARQRAAERALAEKLASDTRDRTERLNATSRDKTRKDYEPGECFRDSTKEGGGTRMKASSDVPCAERFQSVSSSSSSQRYAHKNVSTEKFEGARTESALRCKARLERHQRTAERAAKALAEKNLRDILAQREQAERNRLAESLDAEIRRWSSGKEGNLRALLSTLQYILGPESGWHPVPLTDVITAVAVKKAYRKATLCVHPDKLQQRGASIQQKYICEKVFDLLKEAWNRFNSEER